MGGAGYMTEPSVWESGASATGQGDEAQLSRRDKARRRRVWAPPAVVIVIGLVIAAGGFVVMVTDYPRYIVPSGAMSPTIGAEEQVLFRKDVDVERGDIVVFRAAWGQENHAEAPWIKRIIGVGGDTVACCDEDGNVQVNGRSVREPYVASRPQREFTATVPDGMVFVMGDNRPNSYDSRLRLGEPDRGGIPLSAIEGVAVAAGSDYRELHPTTAFTDAGLPNRTDRAGLVDVKPFAAAGGGLLLALTGLLWLVAALFWLRRKTSQARAIR